MYYFLHDNDLDVSLGIEDLHFEANLVSNMDKMHGWFRSKLMSSPGPLISDFVTHEAAFEYSTYGIHVGQDDRLTFVGNEKNIITGYFVDCREGSPTATRSVVARFAPSLYRRLIIPRGVAHTFDGLEHIVTRDEPVWYSDVDNIDWNVDNDLISVPRKWQVEAFPIVRPNRFKMPVEGHRFMSRLSQSLLESPKSYMARYLLRIAGEDRYVMFEPKEWTNDSQELEQLLAINLPAGFTIKRARYAATGPASWTLVPSTGACVADVLSLPALTPSESQLHFYHLRTRKIYTFLTQGVDIQVSTVDCRPHTGSHGQRSQFSFISDPRVTFRIEPGVCYRFAPTSDVIVRCEHEVFVATNEPRDDLPLFGEDLLILQPSQPLPFVTLPTLKCPDDVVYLMAQQEVEFAAQALSSVTC
jgi:hypothetical protein